MKKKRVLAGALALVLAVGVLPCAAFADDAEELPEEELLQEEAEYEAFLARNDVSNISTTVMQEDYTYTGSPITPVIEEVVAVNGRKLTPDQYTVTGDTSATEVGEYHLTITAKEGSGFTGSTTRTWWISYVCVYEETLTGIEPGQFDLYLNGVFAGTCDFIREGEKWLIRDVASGKYYAYQNATDRAPGTLVMVADPNKADQAAWSYTNGCFCMTVKSRTDNIFNWLVDSVFALINNSGESIDKTVYLSNGRLSDSMSFAFLRHTRIDGEHSYSGWTSNGDGTHSRYCTKCGKVELGKCEFGADGKCTVCSNASSVAKKNIGVSVAIKSKTSGLILNRRTSYTYQINVEASGTKVRWIEYSLDGGRIWLSGSAFVMPLQLKSFRIRVTDADNYAHVFVYNEGTVSEIAG